MDRRSTKTAGRDCISVPDSCPHTPKCGGKYGRAGERWLYVTVANDGLTALSLAIATDILPVTSPYVDQEASRKPLAERRTGSDLSLHAVFPIDNEILRRGAPGAVCEFLVGGRCHVGYTSALDADRFFRAYGDPTQFEQPESFWQALELTHLMRDTEARSRRLDTTHTQCPTCGGHGVIGREDQKP